MRSVLLPVRHGAIGWHMATGPKPLYLGRKKIAEFRSASAARLVSRRSGCHMALGVGMRN